MGYHNDVLLINGFIKSLITFCLAQQNIERYSKKNKDIRENCCKPENSQKLGKMKILYTYLNVIYFLPAGDSGLIPLKHMQRR